MQRDNLGGGALPRYESNVRNEKVYGEGEVTLGKPPEILIQARHTCPALLRVAEETTLLKRRRRMSG